jgi:uncharacterized Fe-S cluster-containing protein
MKKPCRADLEDAAEFLRYIRPEADEANACRRVALWLDYVARETDDRSRARKLGCTVKYLRNVIDKEDAALLADANAHYSAVQIVEMEGR